MGNQFYQDSFIRQPSLVDDAIKLKQLGIQQDALGQRRESQRQSQFKDAPKLSSGWGVHATPNQQSYAILLGKKQTADATGDLAESNRLNSQLKINKMLYENDKNYGAEADRDYHLATGRNASDFTQESIDQYVNWYKMQGEALTVAEDGTFLFDGKPESPNNSRFTHRPKLVLKDDFAYGEGLKALNSLKRNWMQTGDEYETVNEEDLRGVVGNYVDELGVEGDRAEELKLKYFSDLNAPPRKVRNKPKEPSEGGGFSINFGGKDYTSDRWAISQIKDVQTGAGASDLPKTRKGVTIDYIGKNNTSPNIPMGFIDESSSYKKEQQGEIRVTELTKDPESGKIYAKAYGSRKVPNKRMVDGELGEFPNDFKVEKGDITFEVTLSNKSKIERMLPKDVNGKSLTLDELFYEPKNDYTDEQLSEFVGGGASLEDLKGMSNAEIKDIEKDFDNQPTEGEQKRWDNVPNGTETKKEGKLSKYND